MKLSLFRRWNRCANLVQKSNTINSHSKRRLDSETLEPRQLLAADPIITEFQAVNGSTITDEDGDTPDWIELFNPDGEPISLDGWYLTDDGDDLAKWRFPTGTQIDAGGFLLVFASGKNRTNPEGTLHTNFKLSSGGEFLAVVEPDGVTPAQSFDTYPDQIENSSYGLAPGREVTRLIDKGGDIRAIVPSDNSLGADWRDVNFDDAAWLSGTSGVGYETLETGYTISDSFDGPLADAWTVDNPGISTVNVADGNLVINVPNSPNGQLATSEDRGLAPMVIRDIPRYEATGETASTWEISTNVTQGSADRGDVGFAILDGDTGIPILKMQYQRRGSFQIEANDDRVNRVRESGEDAYSLRLVRNNVARNWTGYFKLPDDADWTQVGSARDGVDVPVIANPKLAIIAEATSSSTMNATFDSVEIVASDEQPTYEAEIGLNVDEQLRNVNSSLFVRMPFSVEGSPSEFDELNLTARFDDGFRAYLNGRLVAEQNAPLAPPPPAPNEIPWNAQAQGSHGASNGFIPSTSIDLTPYLENLNQGDNVLAVQALNLSSDDRDFFFDAKLSGSEFVSVKEQAFVNPTPASQNLAPAAPKPVIVANEGVFFDNVKVTIENPLDIPGFEIRYTTDGSDPTLESPLYGQPLVLTESAMLQARVFDTGETPIDPSPVATATFIAVTNSLKERDSDIPIILLDTLTDRLIPDGSNALTTTNVIAFEVSEETGRAKIGDNVDYLGRGGIRDRGSSTANQAKPNLTFETWGADGNHANDDTDVALLGFSAESDWVLHAPFNYDRAMIRNQIAYGISNEIGRWAPGTRAVEVYLNRADGIVSEADYMGVYVLVEKIKTGPGRLDITPIDSRDVTEPDISGGYVWKIDRPDPDAGQFSAGGQSNLNWVHPKSPSSRSARDDQKATDEQVDWVRNHLNDMNTAIRRTDINDPEGYSNYIDVGSWIDHHIMGVFLDDVDAFVLSAYLFKDRDGKIELGPNWDFDRSMESLDGRDDDPLKWGGSGGSDFFTRTWFGQLFRDEGFWQRYVDRWTELRKTHFSHDNLDAIINRFAGEVEEAQVRNFEASVNRGVRPRRSSAYQSGKLDSTWVGEVEHLRTWVHARAAFFDSNFVQPPIIAIDGTIVPAVEPGTDTVTRGVQLEQGSTVEIRGPVVEFFNDTPLVDGTVGVAPVRYFAPTDNSLEEVWFTPDFDDAAWESGTNGIGFKTNGDFDEFISTPAQPAEDGTTIYTRFKFDVDDLSIVDDKPMTLRLRFDDGVVAYLNGEEIFRENIRDDELAWDSRARTRRNPDAIEFADFDVSEFKSLLKQGTNVLAIRAINASATSNDMLLNAALVAREVQTASNPDAKLYYTTDGSDPRGTDGMPSPNAIAVASGEPIEISQNTRIIARNFDDITNRGDEARLVQTDWSATTFIDFTIGTPDVTISEINYAPADASDDEIAAGFATEDYEFVELHNQSDQPADLLGLHLQGGIDFDFFDATNRVIGAGEYALVVANQAAFESRYGGELPVIGEYAGQLNNNGESVELVRSDGTTLTSVDFQDSDPWPRRADGFGATLQQKSNLSNSATEALGKWYNWEASTEVGGNPGRAGQPNDGIVINEIVANTRGLNRLSDAIELHNTTTESVDIGGWFLSDSDNDYFKFEIPDETSIAAGGYISFTEPTLGFALGANGDSVWLTQQDADGGVGSFVDDIHFGPTINGQSLGRVPDGGRLYPLATRSIGQSNGAADVGPLVVSELHYNPAVSDPAVAASADVSASDLEFVEVHNASDQSVDISGWRLRGGVDFNFPAGTLLAPDSVVVVLKFNPQRPVNADLLAAFEAQYDLAPGTILQGGYAGTLNNEGELIQLRRPAVINPDTPDEISFVPIDEVLYDNLQPWPTSANGAGQSLHRIDKALPGSSPAAFAAGTPTPGAIDGVIQGDFNDDGQLDVNDINLLLAELRSNTPDSRFDLTGDDAVNDEDRDFMIESLLGTTYGDSNLDGVFDSTDFVLIFQAAEYEDDVDGNSTWETGDWDGDGDFTTRDFVFAFRQGKYVAE